MVAIIFFDPKRDKGNVPNHTLHTASCGDVHRARTGQGSRISHTSVEEFDTAEAAHAYVDEYELGAVDDAPCLRRA